MKKLLLTALAVASFTFTYAQDSGFTKGDRFISGSFGFNAKKAGNTQGTSFTIAPRIGFFASKNIAIGAKIGYAFTKEEYRDDFIVNPILTEENIITNSALSESDVKTNSILIGVFGRYIVTPATKYSIFTELGFSYVSGKNETTFPNSTYEAKANGYDLEITPGIYYFISDNFALEATWGILSYGSNKVKNAKNATQSFDIGLNLEDINLGLIYKF